MLAIRLQRTGRKGHAQFRVIVQDSHRSPKSGKVVAQLGSYNPHTKAVAIDKDKADFYLTHGAQPSDRVVLLLQSEGVTMPKWVKVASTKEGKIRNPEKLRVNRSAEPVAATPEETSAATTEETVEAESPTAEVAPEDTITKVDTTPEPAIAEQPVTENNETKEPEIVAEAAEEVEKPETEEQAETKVEAKA